MTIRNARPSSYFYTFCKTVKRYDTRCYFNVRSKADMSQLNLPHDRWIRLARGGSRDLRRGSSEGLGDGSPHWV